MGWRRSALLGGAVVLAVTAGAVPVAARIGAAPAPTASEVGISPTEIRIGVIADVDTPLSPGLFQASPDSVRGFARYINAHGGLAGRKLVVDFIDSHLNADEARNAIITACTKDFALVGTAALFVSNVDDLVGCKDQSGQAVGLPDIPLVTTEAVHQCSPVSYPVNPPALICSTKDQHPQTYQSNVGRIRYYQKKYGKKLHGVFVNSGELRSAHDTIEQGYKAAQSLGVTSDGEFNVNTPAPQSAYTPIVQSIKDHASTYSGDQLPFDSSVSLRKEAKLQGASTVKVWDCPTTCYDARFLKQGGADVEGEYVPIGFLPFDEADTNKMLAAFEKYTGKDKLTGLGVSAWAASVLFRDAVNDVVAKSGNNALTRSALLNALKQTKSFDADGMIGKVDVGDHKAGSCGVMTQVKNGKFVRLDPTKRGTFNCDPKSVIAIKLDLL